MRNNAQEENSRQFFFGKKGVVNSDDHVTRRSEKGRFSAEEIPAHLATDSDTTDDNYGDIVADSHRSRLHGSVASLAAEELLASEQRLFHSLAGDLPITFHPGNQWAFNPVTGECTYDLNTFTDEGYIRSQALFLALHEIKCHMIERAKLMQSVEGQEELRNLDQRVREKPWKHLWMNIYEDVKGNRAVMDLATSLRKPVRELYEHKQTPTGDFRSFPLHVQFMYSVLRQGMLPGADIQVDRRVQEILDKLRNSPQGDLIDMVTNPYVDPVLTKILSREVLEPVIEELYQQAKKESKVKQVRPKKEGKPDTPSSSSELSDEPSKGKGKNGKKKEKQKKGKNSNREKEESNDEDNESEAEGKDPFTKDYQEYERHHHELFDENKLRDSLREFLGKAAGGNLEARQAMAYQQEMGVSYQDVQEYRKEYQIVEPYIDELMDAFRQLVERRLRYKRRLTRTDSEGITINSQRLPDIYGALHHKIELPGDVMVDYEKKLVESELPGSFTLHLVGDKSASMREGDKAAVQRGAAILVVEALARLEEELIKNGLTDDLIVRTDLRAFSSGLVTIYKTIDQELDEMRRVAVFKGLSENIRGGTNDYAALSQIREEILRRAELYPSYLMELKDGTRQEVLVVLSDGESGNKNEALRQIYELRQLGVKVFGVGMTTSGSPTVELYSPDGQVCEDIGHLSEVMYELIRKSLQSL